MDEDTAIRERIEQSFGDGPAWPQADVLAAGRRALRRRRRTLAATAAVAVLAVVGTTAVAAGRGAGTSSPPVAGRPTGAPSTSVPSTSPAPAEKATGAPAVKPPTRTQIERALRRGLADLDAAGHLDLVPGAVVVRRIDNPYRVAAPGTSLALVVDYRGGRYWYALDRQPDGSGGGASLYAEDTPDLTFAAWVEAQRPFPASGSPDPSAGPGDWPGVDRDDLVRFAAGTEQLLPRAGVRILAQRAHVSVGASFAAPDDRTAAASVVDADGKRFYVLARGPVGAQGE